MKLSEILKLAEAQLPKPEWSANVLIKVAIPKPIKVLVNESSKPMETLYYEVTYRRILSRSTGKIIWAFVGLKR